MPGPLIVLAIARADDAAALRAAVPALDMLFHADLAAVTQPVPATRDAAWLRAADATIASLHEAATIIPGCLASPLPDDPAAERALAARAEHLLAQLDRVAGCDQWTLRLTPAAAATTTTSPSTTASPPGVAYLRALKHRVDAESAPPESLLAAARHRFPHALALARETRVLPATPLLPTPRVALLAPRSARDDLAALAPALRGPTPPFDFVTDPDPAAATAPSGTGVPPVRFDAAHPVH